MEFTNDNPSSQNLVKKKTFNEEYDEKVNAELFNTSKICELPNDEQKEYLNHIAMESVCSHIGKSKAATYWQFREYLRFDPNSLVKLLISC